MRKLLTDNNSQTRRHTDSMGVPVVGAEAVIVVRSLITGVEGDSVDIVEVTVDVSVVVNGANVLVVGIIIVLAVVIFDSDVVLAGVLGVIVVRSLVTGVEGDSVDTVEVPVDVSAGINGVNVVVAGVIIVMGVVTFDSDVILAGVLGVIVVRSLVIGVEGDSVNTVGVTVGDSAVVNGVNVVVGGVIIVMGVVMFDTDVIVTGVLGVDVSVPMDSVETAVVDFAEVVDDRHARFNMYCVKPEELIVVAMSVIFVCTTQKYTETSTAKHVDISKHRFKQSDSDVYR